MNKNSEEIKSYENEIEINIDGVNLKYLKIFDKNIKKNIYHLWANCEGYRVHFILNKTINERIKFKIISITNLKSRINEPNISNVELPGEIRRQIIGSVKKFIKSYLSYKPMEYYKNVRKPYKDD